MSGAFTPEKPRRKGIFATGATADQPHRLSLIRLLNVAGPTVRFAGVDLVDGTPVVDLKPYVSRFDRPAGAGLSGSVAGAG
jgi:tRNA (adenine37-N6)-methyltransferase